MFGGLGNATAGRVIPWSLRADSLLINLGYISHVLVIGARDNTLFNSIYKTLHAFMHEEIRKAYEKIADLSEVAKYHLEIVGIFEMAELDSSSKRFIEHMERVRWLLQH